jgi:hypothetical protein
MAGTQIADVIVPEVFNPYVQQLTEVKSRLIGSGALVSEPMLDQFLLGGGNTGNAPSWKDLADDADNVSSDALPTVSDATPKKTAAVDEIFVRLSRNQVWQTSDLAGDLAGSDPMASIASRVAAYRARRYQDVFVATITGLFADNAAAPSGSEHTAGDMTNDISGSSFTDGVTNFSAEAFIDAKLTMGDSMDDLALMMVHSVVYARMQKNNLIDFIPDSQGVVNIPTFQGVQVIVDDAMPKATSVYNTWLFGRGAVRLGQGGPKTPTETFRNPLSGNGGGGETLHHRWELIMHPVGNKFVGTVTSGGPANAATSGNLAHADSWMRVYPERKQVKIARLITREA